MPVYFWILPLMVQRNGKNSTKQRQVCLFSDFLFSELQQENIYGINTRFPSPECIFVIRGNNMVSQPVVQHTTLTGVIFVTHDIVPEIVWLCLLCGEIRLGLSQLEDMSTLIMLFLVTLDTILPKQSFKLVQLQGLHDCSATIGPKGVSIRQSRTHS